MRSNRGGELSVAGFGLQHLREEEARETDDQHVEHDADDDLVDQVPDRERGEHEGDEHAGDVARDQARRGLPGERGDHRGA